MLVETVIEDDRWAALDLEALAERAARTALAVLGAPAEGYQVVLMAGDDARIAVLNADFRGKLQPTNVLSWPSEERGADTPGGRPEMPDPGTLDEPMELGDIALAYETCAGEAEAAGEAMADHVTHLIVHGVLHLLGYDHIDEADAALMEGLEVQALADLGLPDPY